MPEITIALVIAAFLAGIFMFLAPCTLPLVPAYLAFISGLQREQVSDQTYRAQMIRNASLFVLGFTIVFVGFGVLAGLAGFWVGQYKALLAQIGGGFIVIFALLMLGLLKLPFLQADRRMAVPEIFKRGTPQAAFMIGVTFALGWTPCVGPILASILLLASTTATVFSGAILLLVFSLGLAIPFLLVAMLYARSSVVIERYSYVAQSINFIGGVLLLLMGILLMTEQFGTMVEYGYRFFYFIGLGSLFSFF